MVTISRSKINNLIAEEVDRNYTEPSHAEAQVHPKETLVDMLELGNIAASNEIRKVSARILETIVLESFSRGAADDFMTEFFKRWSQSDTFLSAVVVRIAYSAMFIRPVAVFIKQHLDSTTDDSRLTQPYA